MEVYETEEQQVEAIRNWLKKRGKLLVSMIAVISLSIGGVQYVRHHKALSQQAASSLYQGLIVAVEKQDLISAKTKATQLNSEYESSIYGTLAKLYLAKVAIQDQKFDQAKSYFEWVLKNSPSAEFKSVARLRLAKLLFTQKKTDAALSLLNEGVDNKNQKNDHYLSLLQEFKADILSSQNKSKEAYALYKMAQEAILKKELQNPLLKMKIEELGES